MGANYLLDQEASLAFVNAETGEGVMHVVAERRGLPRHLVERVLRDGAAVAEVDAKGRFVQGSFGRVRFISNSHAH